MSMLFIYGGTVIDPETLTRIPADVLCAGGKIERLCPRGTPLPQGAEAVNAEGCFVCPGFIDPHGHIDGCVHTGVLSLLQGITTTVGGNCGFSPLHIGDFLHEQRHFPIHQAELVGHCALREAAGAADPFKPTTREQVRRMEALCERALCEGAAGVSLGPGYAPGSTLEEMEALCRLARRYGRFAAIDTRMYGLTDLHSLQEAISLAAVSGCRMIISHFEYQYGVGVEYEALEMLEVARQSGVDLYLDSGMYKDWCSSIGSALFEPVTMRDNGIELRHLRVITGEHIGELPDQALYEHLRAEHAGDAHGGGLGADQRCAGDQFRLHGFKRLGLDAQQRAQRHAPARGRSLRLLHGRAHAQAHRGGDVFKAQPVLKITRRLQRTHPGQISLRVEHLEAHPAAHGALSHARLHVFKMGLCLHAQDGHRIAHASGQRRLPFNGHLLLIRGHKPFKAQRLARQLQFHAPSLPAIHCSRDRMSFLYGIFGLFRIRKHKKRAHPRPQTARMKRSTLQNGIKGIKGNGRLTPSFFPTAPRRQCRSR